MLPFAENLEVEKNNFAKWINFTVATGALVYTFYHFTLNGEVFWPGILMTFLFGGIYYQNVKNKIVSDRDGFKYIGLLRTTEVLWKDINAVNYAMKYRSHSLQPDLEIIYGSKNKSISFTVSQFQKKQMQRFYEILDEQSPRAQKNENFLKVAKADLTWKEQLKMIYK
jgi:hypothetical protein